LEGPDLPQFGLGARGWWWAVGSRASPDIEPAVSFVWHVVRLEMAAAVFLPGTMDAHDSTLWVVAAGIGRGDDMPFSTMSHTIVPGTMRHADRKRRRLSSGDGDVGRLPGIQRHRPALRVPSDLATRDGRALSFSGWWVQS